MNFIVLADNIAFETIQRFNPSINWIRVEDVQSFTDHHNADAFFDLTENAIINEHPGINQPLFIHSVNESLPAGKNAIRINAWNGFLENEIWELAGNITAREEEVLSALGKKMIRCEDEPGFIAPRVIAMIINEAYFAKGENVSTEDEIDIAMKLGTNYPYGPFEWARKIGIQNIYALLEKLAQHDKRYQAAPLLTKTVSE